MLEPLVPADEETRLATLRSLDILDTPPEERFDRITAAAARAFRVPITLVTLVDSERQWFKSRQGLELTETPRCVSFCGHAIHGDDVFQVVDATRDERFADNPLVTGEPGVRFYAGQPLHALDGSKLGTLCLMDRAPRSELTAPERHALGLLASRVEDELNARRVKLADYQLLEVIGRGGMGVVYRARDERLGREVAVKVILRQQARSERFVERFRREARGLARVSHPNVLTIFHVGEERGVHFLVSELLEGGTLDRRIRRLGGLPWRETATLGAQLAGALAAIHEAGLVHRDLKPGNVLYDRKGRPKLGDFGLVRAVSGAPGAGPETPSPSPAELAPLFAADPGLATVLPELTEVGAMTGTPAYMAPEQALGGAEGVDARADLYALGATLYACLSGRPPFEGWGSSLTARVIGEAPRPLVALGLQLPPALERLVLRLLAKFPDDRPREAALVADELEDLARRSQRAGGSSERLAPSAPSAKPDSAGAETVLRLTGGAEPATAPGAADDTVVSEPESDDRTRGDEL